MKCSAVGGLLFFAALTLAVAQAAPLLAAELTPADNPPPSFPEVRTEPQTDQIIIKFKNVSLRRAPKIGSGQVKALSARAGLALAHKRAMSGEGQVFRLPRKMKHAEAKAIADKLGGDPSVEYAVVDRIMHPSMTPNDAYYGAYQWDLKAPVSEVAGTNLPRAWDISTGTGVVVVGVLDTGIVNHADLQGRILPGYNFVSDPYMAGNGIGRGPDASDLGDWESSGTGTLTPSSWHGSHVTGTIAATSNNGIGITGINWNTKILPVRVLGHGGGYWSDIADGMRWSAGIPVQGVPLNPYPARVINLSLGGIGSCDAASQSAVDDTIAAGTVVVVSAGNSNTDAAGFSPAACNGVITVAALARSANKASYSNYGQSVEIAAPGDLILSTINSGTTSPVASPSGDSYGQYSGTSMAAPHVTGVVSLLLSVNPSLTPAQVVGALKATARPFPAGSDCTTSRCGAGMLDAYAALSAVVTNTPMIAASPTRLNLAQVQDASSPGTSLSIDVVNGAGTTWSVSSDAPWIHFTPGSGQGAATPVVTIDTAGLAPGEHDATISVTAPGASNSPLTIPVTFQYKGVLKVNAPLPVATSAPALAAVGQKVYVIGGVPALSAVQIYDTGTDTWTSGASKPTGGSYFNAAVISGKIYVPGGPTAPPTRAPWRSMIPRPTAGRPAPPCRPPSPAPLSRR
jgi:serine protease